MRDRPRALPVDRRPGSTALPMGAVPRLPPMSSACRQAATKPSATPAVHAASTHRGRPPPDSNPRSTATQQTLRLASISTRQLH